MQRRSSIRREWIRRRAEAPSHSAIAWLRADGGASANLTSSCDKGRSLLPGCSPATGLGHRRPQRLRRGKTALARGLVGAVVLLSPEQVEHAGRQTHLRQAAL